MTRRGPIILIVLDGWGWSDEHFGNAVALARKPVWDRLITEFPFTKITTSGEAVGLPKGQMGNSEVGHLNLGAGRIVYQDIVRISKSIESGELFRNPLLVNLMEEIRNQGRSLHFMGLVSDGGVHSHIDHLYALLKMAKDFNLKNVYVHAFMDGRDTPPDSGLKFMMDLVEFMKSTGVGAVSTVMGRYYAMDRDKRWERVEKAYNAIVMGKAEEAEDPVKAISNSYKKGITDEFITPTVIVHDGNKKGTVKDGDGVIFFNFRADRARQLVWALTQQDFSFFERPVRPVVKLLCMTLYDEKLDLPVIFEPVSLENILPHVFAEYRIRNLRIAETEKYAHVTYFFNGGEEKEFPYEERILIPSPKVPTYELKPEMSAYEVTERVIEMLKREKFPFTLLNYANPDMVGHTGVLSAAVKAIEVVDECLGRVLEYIEENDGVALITADHGNAEKMIDEDGKPHTAHTTNPVAFILFDKSFKGRLREGGALCDVAPTVLGIMGIPQPPEMTGRDLRII